MELFYPAIRPKWQHIAKNERMRLQVDLEFQQNEIKKLNKKYVVEVFISRVHVGKAYSTEKTPREFKKSFGSKVKKHTKQFPAALDLIQKC